MPFVNGRRVKTKLAAVDSIGSAVSVRTLESQNSQGSAQRSLSQGSEDDGTVDGRRYTVHHPDGPNLGVSQLNIFVYLRRISCQIFFLV